MKIVIHNASLSHKESVGDSEREKLRNKSRWRRNAKKKKM
jgi:hypothetical protein